MVGCSSKLLLAMEAGGRPLCLLLLAMAFRADCFFNWIEYMEPNGSRSSSKD